MPARAIAWARETLEPPPSSLTASQPASCRNRPPGRGRRRLPRRPERWGSRRRSPSRAARRGASSRPAPEASWAGGRIRPWVGPWVWMWLTCLASFWLAPSAEEGRHLGVDVDDLVLPRDVDDARRVRVQFRLVV